MLIILKYQLFLFFSVILDRMIGIYILFCFFFILNIYYLFP